MPLVRRLPRSGAGRTTTSASATRASARSTRARERPDDGWYVVDLDSTNGLRRRIAGRRVAPARWRARRSVWGPKLRFIPAGVDPAELPCARRGRRGAQAARGGRVGARRRPSPQRARCGLLWLLLALLIERRSSSCSEGAREAHPCGPHRRGHDPLRERRQLHRRRRRPRGHLHRRRRHGRARRRRGRERDGGADRRARARACATSTARTRSSPMARRCSTPTAPSTSARSSRRTSRGWGPPRRAAAPWRALPHRPGRRLARLPAARRCAAAAHQGPLVRAGAGRRRLPHARAGALPPVQQRDHPLRGRGERRRARRLSRRGARRGRVPGRHDGLTGMVDDRRLEQLLTSRAHAGRMVDALSPRPTAAAAWTTSRRSSCRSSRRDPARRTIRPRRRRWGRFGDETVGSSPSCTSATSCTRSSSRRSASRSRARPSAAASTAASARKLAEAHGRAKTELGSESRSSGVTLGAWSRSSAAEQRRPSLEPTRSAAGSAARRVAPRAIRRPAGRRRRAASARCGTAPRTASAG